MDFNTLSRRQLQALCKKNKIPANVTNVAMANALTSLHFVEGFEEILNSQVPQSPMVPPTAVSSSVQRKIEVSSNKSLDENDAFVKTPASRRRMVKETSTVKPVYSTRRSARLAKKIQEPKQISEAIKIGSFIQEIDKNVEVEMKESYVDQSQISEITVLDNLKKMLTLSEEIELRNNDEFKENSEEKSDIPNEDVAVASIEQIVASDIKADTEMSSVDKETKASMEESEPNTDVGEETQASTDKETEMQADVGDEARALIEKDTGMSSNVEEETEMKSNVGEGAKAFIEKETGINSNIEEKTEMQSNVGEEAKAFIDKETGTISNLEEETDMQSNVGEEAKAFIIQEETEMQSKSEEAKSLIEKETEINCNLEEETKASIEDKIEMNFNVDEEIRAEKDTEMNSNVDEGTKASVEKDTEINANVDDEAQASTEKETKTQSVVGAEAKAFIEKDTGMSSNAEEETEAFIEENVEMNFNVSEESKASIEKDAIVDEGAKSFTEKDTELNSSVNEETKPSIEKETMVDEEAKGFTEKDTEMNSNVDEEAKDFFEVIEMNSNEDSETKASIPEDTNMSFKENVEIVVAEFKVVDSCNVANERQFGHDEQDKKLEAYAEDIENDGDEESDISDGDELVDDKDNLESVTEFNQEEMAVSEDNIVLEVEIQNELLNSEAKHESDFFAIGSDRGTPLTKSADNAPKTVKRLTRISDDKENVDSGKKSNLLQCEKPKKMPYEGYSIRKLEKMIQEKLKKTVSEDIVVPEVEIQNELLNPKAKHESDPTRIVAPLINDDVSSIEPLKTSLNRTPSTKSENKAPITVKGLTQISDNIEKVDSGRKSILLKGGKPKKMPYEDCSVRKLEKILQEKLKNTDNLY